MPMSFAASLGTTLTLVSAPAFLLAANLLERSGSAGLDIFSITPIGIALVGFGLAYMLLARWMLPKRSGKDRQSTRLHYCHKCAARMTASVWRKQTKTRHVYKTT